MKKIFVVDDEQELLEIISIQLDLFNLSCDTSNNFIQAKHKLESGEYAAAIIDKNIMGKDGEELVSLAQSKGIKTIMFTGDPEYRSSKAEFHLPKPYTEDQFEDILVKCGLISKAKANQIDLVNENVNSNFVLDAIGELAEDLGKYLAQQQAEAAIEYVLKDSDKDKLSVLQDWMKSKDFNKGDIDDIGDAYKKLSKSHKGLPDWDEAVHFAFNEAYFNDENEVIDKMYKNQIAFKRKGNSGVYLYVSDWSYGTTKAGRGTVNKGKFHVAKYEDGELVSDEQFASEDKAKQDFDKKAMGV